MSRWFEFIAVRFVCREWDRDYTCKWYGDLPRIGATIEVKDDDSRQKGVYKVVAVRDPDEIEFARVES